MARLIVSPEASADIDEILDRLERAAGRAVALRYTERFRVVFGQGAHARSARGQTHVAQA